jgi:hypothetical protein
MSDAGSSRSGTSVSSGSRGRGGGSSGSGSCSASVGSSTSQRGTPSDHRETSASCLGPRGIEAAEAAYDSRLDSKEGAAAIARELLSSHVGCDETYDPDGTLLKGLISAFNCAYAKEEDFSIAVFEAMAQCFDSDSCRWTVEFDPPKDEWKKERQGKKEGKPHFMVITGRKEQATAAPAAATTEGKGEELSEALPGVRTSSSAHNASAKREKEAPRAGGATTCSW